MQGFISYHSFLAPAYKKMLYLPNPKPTFLCPQVKAEVRKLKLLCGNKVETLILHNRQ